MLSCPLILILLFSFFFSLSLYLAPNLTSPLPTELECLNQSNPKLERCVYCWNRPALAHPQKSIDIKFPFTNYQFLSTKSCSKITCVEALQMFGEGNTIDNSTDVEFLLNSTHSEIQHHAKFFKRIPPITESWKVFVTVPTGFHLPKIDSFQYPNNEIISKLVLSELAAVLLTWGAFISSFIITEKLLEHKDVSCLQIVLGMTSVLLLYVGANFVELKVIELMVVGLAKAIFVHYIIRSVPAFYRYFYFSVISMLIILALQVYEAYYPTMFTGIYLLSVTVILAIKAATQHDAWSKEVTVGVLSLGIFSLCELILTLEDYYTWRILRIYVMGLGVTLLHALNLSQSQSEVKAYEIPEEGSIVQLDESTI